MTSNEITTGSLSASTQERKIYAARSRWWNSTGGGSSKNGTPANKGNVKAGDGGAKFREEWPDLDLENQEWMWKNGINHATGQCMDEDKENLCGPHLSKASSSSSHQTQAVVDAVVQQRNAGRGWVSRHKVFLAGCAVLFYIVVARMLSGDGVA